MLKRETKKGALTLPPLGEGARETEGGALALSLWNNQCNGL